MTIITQDGRTLLLKDGDKVEFKAVLYCGHIQRGYVSAEIQPVGYKKLIVRHEVILGEYEAPKGNEWSIAEKAAKAVREAFEQGKQLHIMLGNKGTAPGDDLMSTIAMLDTLYAQNSPKGWVLEFGMINGVTNNRYKLNPDENGSYANAAKARYEKINPTAEAVA